MPNFAVPTIRAHAPGYKTLSYRLEYGGKDLATLIPFRVLFGHTPAHKRRGLTTLTMVKDKLP